MNREFHLITNRLVQEPKVKKVVFYTNGTIIPSDEQLKSLMNKKVFIIITDYGALSRNIKGLMQKLEHNNIAFYVRKANGWTDCSKIIKHNRPVEQNKKILRDCCAKNTFTLSNNKLFHCPFAANADRLSAVPSFENDFIDILQQDNGTKTKVKEFVSNIDFLKVCDWCNGRPFDGQEIQPAVQISKPLDYERI
jgi:hypothetical protein